VTINLSRNALHREVSWLVLCLYSLLACVLYIVSQLVKSYWYDGSARSCNSMFWKALYNQFLWRLGV